MFILHIKVLMFFNKDIVHSIGSSSPTPQHRISKETSNSPKSEFFYGTILYSVYRACIK